MKITKSWSPGIPRGTQKGGKSTQVVVGSVVDSRVEKKRARRRQKGGMWMSKPSKIQRRSIRISHASVGDKTTQTGVQGPSFRRSGEYIYYEKASKHDLRKNSISRPDSGAQIYPKRCVQNLICFCLDPPENVFFRVSVTLGPKACFFYWKTNRF